MWSKIRLVLFTTNQINTIYAIGKKVNQYNLNGEFIASFRTLKEAGDSLGTKSYSAIRKVCNGIHKKSYGFKWKWVDE